LIQSSNFIENDLQVIGLFKQINNTMLLSKGASLCREIASCCLFLYILHAICFKYILNPHACTYTVGVMLDCALHDALAYILEG